MNEKEDEQKNKQMNEKKHMNGKHYNKTDERKKRK